ncbi:MAG: hypothetical protein MUQ10_02290 [Anaerolineae bacterium]|nr:hypothetical protein [Anaerolineae bacterium]
MASCKECVAGRFGLCHSGEYCRVEREVLVEEAVRIVEERAHVMGECVKVKGCSQWVLRCELCGRSVLLDLNPAPGEPDISGDALAEDCDQL